LIGINLGKEGEGTWAWDRPMWARRMESGMDETHPAWTGQAHGWGQSGVCASKGCPNRSSQASTDEWPPHDRCFCLKPCGMLRPLSAS